MIPTSQQEQPPLDYEKRTQTMKRPYMKSVGEKKTEWKTRSLCQEPVVNFLQSTAAPFMIWHCQSKLEQKKLPWTDEPAKEAIQSEDQYAEEFQQQLRVTLGVAFGIYPAFVN